MHQRHVLSAALGILPALGPSIVCPSVSGIFHHLSQPWPCLVLKQSFLPKVSLPVFHPSRGPCLCVQKAPALRPGASPPQQHTRLHCKWSPKTCRNKAQLFIPTSQRRPHLAPHCLFSHLHCFYTLQVTTRSVYSSPQTLISAPSLATFLVLSHPLIWKPFSTVPPRPPLQL